MTESDQPDQPIRPAKKAAFAPPTFVPPSDWEERPLPFKIGSGRTLASQFQSDGTDLGESRIRLRVYFRKADGHLIGRVWFGDGAEGPPGHVHGGASAYVLDEAMGSAGWMHHLPVLAANLNFDYHRPTPLYQDLTIEAWLHKPLEAWLQKPTEAWLHKPDERRIKIHSRLSLNGKICVSGTGEFAIMPKSKISLLADPNDPQVQAILQNSLVRWAAE